MLPYICRTCALLFPVEASFNRVLYLKGTEIEAQVPGQGLQFLSKLAFTLAVPFSMHCSFM